MPSDPARADHLTEMAIGEGVGCLLARATAGRDVPAFAAARLKAYARGREILTAIVDAEVARVLDALAAGRVRALVIKGAHLSHSLYPSPALRPRTDTDLLVAAEDRGLVPDLLAELGYERFPHTRGTVILGQFHFIRTDRAGVVHALDVHWRIAAPLIFANVPDFDTLRSMAVPIRALGAHAFGPSSVHALVVACIHLTAHHRGGATLLWLHDLRLLAQSLDESQQVACADAARRFGVTAICANALSGVRAYFDDPSLASLIRRITAGGAAQPEPSAQLLSVTRPFDELLLDLRTPVDWRTRLTLLREHLLPETEYMRARGNHGWLPLAYARRAVLGASKWWNRH